MHDLKRQTTDALFHLKSAPEFIQEHKLWRGYFKHGWVAISTVLLGALITYLFCSNLWETIKGTDLSAGAEEPVGMGVIIEKSIFSGGIKYILLIVLEMLIFHFSVRTLDILNGQESNTTPKDFIQAQIRMIKISLRNYCLEIVAGILLAVFLGILGVNGLKTFLMYFVQFYFIGYAFMDNYFEQKEMGIKESSPYIWEHRIAAIIIGGFGYLCFMVPLIGAILGPFICSLAATAYLFYNVSEDHNASRENIIIEVAS